MITRLPPTRRAVPLRATPAARPALQRHFQEFRAHAVQSGTASLAAALRDARALACKPQPEAVIPAYGCPDLITACVCAGVRPRLVDVEAAAWGYRRDNLTVALNDNTVAIVAVNLLGTGDQGAELLEIARQRGVALVQDSAQYLPDTVQSAWPGDYVVLSFGRGKPLNLMQGGLLLSRPSRAPHIDAQLTMPQAQLRGRQRVRYALLASAPAALAFNIMSHPMVYGSISRVPGLGLGATRYGTLDDCRRMPAGFVKKMSNAFDVYAAHANYRITPWRIVLDKWEAAGVRQLHGLAARTHDDGQRLRLPLLAPDGVTRDRLVSALERFGASAMYAASLPQIAGVPEHVRMQGNFPGAVSLADRLFTLPTHEFVDEPIVCQVDAILRRCV